MHKYENIKIVFTLDIQANVHLVQTFIIDELVNKQLITKYEVVDSDQYRSPYYSADGKLIITRVMLRLTVEEKVSNIVNHSIFAIEELIKFFEARNIKGTYMEIQEISFY